MTPPGRNPRRPPDAVTPPGRSGPTQRSPTSSLDHHAALRLIGLAVLGHMLRSRRFYERVTFAAIVLAALARLGQQNRASTLSVWLPGTNGRSSASSAKLNGRPNTLSAS